MALSAFWLPYLSGLALVLGLMSLLWLSSLWLKNASIVDIFWGIGFVLLAWLYLAQAEGGLPARQWLVVALASIWGLRLALYLLWRNWGKGEDFRYQALRRHAGADRFWWVSFFQVFLFQGLLMWLISAPLLGAQVASRGQQLTVWDGLAIGLWLIGFVFEAGGDWQLARFKADPANAGRLLTSGFWRWTRHPNYFGDACVWWAYGLFSIAAGQVLPAAGAVLMTLLLLRYSGVTLLERSLRRTKPGYEAYMARTSAFIPWFPKEGAGQAADDLGGRR